MSHRISIIASVTICYSVSFLVGRMSSEPISVDSTSASPKLRGESLMLTRTGSDQAKRGIRAIGRRGSASSSMESVDAILGITNGAQRAQAWNQFVSTLNSNEIRDAIIRFGRDGGSSGELNDSEYRVLLSAWGRINPYEALDYCSEDASTANIIIGEWAARDANAAIAWAESRQEEDKPNPFMVGVIRGIISSDPERAAELRHAMQPSTPATQADQIIREYQKELGTDATRKWALSIKDPELRGKVITQMADDQALTDPLGTAEWLQANRGEGYEAAMKKVMQRMVESDYDAALAYFQNATDDTTRGIALEQVALVLGRKDTLAAARLIDANRQVATDNTYRSSAYRLRKVDYMLGIKALNNIRNEGMRNFEYSDYMWYWLKEDFDAASNWIDQNRLPGTVQQKAELYRLKIQTDSLIVN